MRGLGVCFLPGDTGILYKAFLVTQKAWKSHQLKQSSGNEEGATGQGCGSSLVQRCGMRCVCHHRRLPLFHKECLWNLGIREVLQIK